MKLNVNIAVVFMNMKVSRTIWLEYKCLSWNEDYSNKFDEELLKKFKNIFKFCNNDINKFILLLRTGVYLYEYMDDWEKFNETTLPEKKIIVT